MLVGLLSPLPPRMRSGPPPRVAFPALPPQIHDRCLARSLMTGVRVVRRTRDQPLTTFGRRLVTLWSMTPALPLAQQHAHRCHQLRGHIRWDSKKKSPVWTSGPGMRRLVTSAALRCASRLPPTPVPPVVMALRSTRGQIGCKASCAWGRAAGPLTDIAAFRAWATASGWLASGPAP